MLSRIAARTAAVAAGCLAAACLVALPSPEPASADGPQSVCSQYDYVNTTLSPYSSEAVLFALNGVHVIDGTLNQNGNVTESAWLSSWMYQNAASNYVVVAAQNQASVNQPAVGYMLENWLC
jgi:hypothetical protein